MEQLQARYKLYPLKGLPVSDADYKVWELLMTYSYTGGEMLKIDQNQIPETIKQLWSCLIPEFSRFEIRTTAFSTELVLFGFRGYHRWLLARWSNSAKRILPFEDMKAKLLKRSQRLSHLGIFFAILGMSLCIIEILQRMYSPANFDKFSVYLFICGITLTLIGLVLHIDQDTRYKIVLRATLTFKK